MMTKRATKKVTTKKAATKKKLPAKKKAPPLTREQKLENILKKIVDKAEEEGTYESLCSDGQRILKSAAKAVGSDAFVGVKMYLTSNREIPFRFQEE